MFLKNPVGIRIYGHFSVINPYGKVKKNFAPILFKFGGALIHIEETKSEAQFCPNTNGVNMADL